MALTITNAIVEAQKIMPDLTTANALIYANQVHREILAQIPELRRDSTSINTITAGQGEYALAEQNFQIDSAWYQTGPSAAQFLGPTNLEDLNQTSQNWQFDASGVPTEFYIGSNQSSGNQLVIGLVPFPNLTTSGGYPKVVLWGSKLQSADLVGGDTCLAALYSSWVYVTGICWYAAKSIRPQMAAAFKGDYDEQMALNKIFSRTRNEPLGKPGIPNIRGGGYQERANKQK